MKRIIRVIDWVWFMLPDIWKLSGGGQSLHFHLISFNDEKKYDIAWKHLHEAELRYKKEWEEYDLKKAQDLQGQIDKMADLFYGKKKGVKMAKKKKKKVNKKK